MCRHLIAGLLALMALTGGIGSSLAEEPQSKDGAPWLLDGSVGIPKLHSNEFKVTGGLLAGYVTQSFGAVAWGSGGYYDFKSGSTLADWQRLEGYGEGWWMSGTGNSDARFELRLSGGAAYYSTSYTGGGLVFTDEDSTLGRGSLLVGGRVRSGKALQASLLAGAGLQLEDYSSLKVPTAAANQGVAIDDSMKVSVRTEGRLRVRWACVPDVLSLRLQADADYFSLRRSDDSIVALRGSVQTTGSVSVYRQVELRPRLFLDVDLLSFGGISPALFAGMDYVAISGTAGSVHSSIPVFGVGLIKPVW